jgi:hypothetical protein
MAPPVHLVLKQPSAIAVGTVCVENWWPLVYQWRGEPEEETPYVVKYASHSNDVELLYIEDPVSECAYVVVDGSAWKKACDAITEQIEVWSTEEMFEELRKAANDTEKILAILRIGVGAPRDYDESFARRLRLGLADEDSAIREAAIAAFAYRIWPELDAELEEISKHDPNEDCRMRASLVLEGRLAERENQST